MKPAVLAAVLLASAPAFAGTIEQPILGGTTTTAGQYPSVVAIEVGGGLCSGTLITPDWVMTAAHCVKGMSLTSIKVHFNTLDALHNPGTVIGASMATYNPGFNENALGSKDIGLIKLAKSVTDIKPIPVNLDATKSPVGTTVTMVGFGATAQGGKGTVGVQYTVQQTVVSCTAQEGSDANLLCYNQVSGKGKCEGDSGGPSFAMIDGRLMQVGITSFGDTQCAQFGADTRTDAERAFLTMNVPNLYCETDADCQMGHECFTNHCITTPFTTGGVGATCTAGTDCESGTCASGGGKSLCTMGCTLNDNTTCPAGLECTDAGGGQGTCWPKSESTGCCDAAGHGAPTMLVGIMLVGFVWRRRRTR